MRGGLDPIRYINYVFILEAKFKYSNPYTNNFIINLRAFKMIY